MSDITANLPQQMASPATVATNGLASRIGLFSRNKSLRAILWLAQRHIAARAISGLAILISAFVFAPADFATFGIFLAILNQTGLLIFLRYDTVLIAAANEQDFHGAICLNAGVMVIALVLTATVAIICVALGVVSPTIAILFVTALAFRGLQRIMGGIVTRHGEFRLIGQMSMLHAGSLPITVLIVWWCGGNGAIAMIASDIVANILATAFLYWHLGHVTRVAFAGQHRLVRALAIAHDWSVLPRVNLPGALLATGFAQLPLVIVVAFASPDMAGHVALLFRVMDFPVQLIMAASTPVLMNRLSKGFVRWTAMPAVVATLAAVVIAIYGSIAAGAFLIEPWIRATSWSGITSMVIIVALFQGAIAFSGPLIEACGLYRQQTPLMLVHAMMLALVCPAFLLSPSWTVALAVVGSVAVLRAGLVAARLLWLSGRMPT
jgi:hypothetical protein